MNRKINKINKMKKEIIYTDVEMQKLINDNKQQKETALNELNSYVSEFVTIDDATDKEALTIAFNAKYHDLPNYISIEKKFELLDFSLSKYTALVDRYKSIKVIDAEVHIYAESKDELSRLKLSKDFLQAFNNIIAEKNGRSVYIAPIVNAMGGILSFNYATGQAEINHQFIKQ